MRFRFHIFKIYFFALLLLIAVLSGAVSFAFFGSNAPSTAEMIYCPLTKKLQPVNQPPENLLAFSLNEICAADLEKTRLVSAISEKLIFKSINLNRENLENLAFDFWQKGRSAFDVLPDAPNAPETAIIKSFSQTTGFGGNFDVKIFWRTTEKFSFQIQSRPPTAVHSLAYSFRICRKLERISRRLAPRAPPFAV